MNKSSSYIKSVLTRQQLGERIFKVCAIGAIVLSLGTLLVLLLDALIDGLPRLDWQFFTSFPSRRPLRAGIYAALVGSTAVVLLTALIAIPIGVGTAVYLEEYAVKNRFTRIIELNIANLAGVPSIIYGLLGLELLVRGLGLGRSLLAGAMTLSLLVLPIVIIASKESIRAVPRTIREAAFALGASRWRVTCDHVLPRAFPGILTGVILSISRAVGETAPLIMIGALTYVAFLPDSLLSPFSVLPIQIFNWVSRPQQGFHTNAAAGIVVLLCVTLLLNLAAVFLRDRFQKKSAMGSV